MRRAASDRRAGATTELLRASGLDLYPHPVHFDRLKEDDGYARGIETAPEEMASSHAVKRFFYAFGWGRIWVFRYLLLRLFLWHLKQVAPEVVRLGLDPMVMDNDAAPLRGLGDEHSRFRWL